MQVKGTITTNVDVSAKECFRALCKEANLFNVLYRTKYDVWWKEVLDKNGKLIQLDEYTDVSYHGSSNDVKSNSITDDRILEIYTHLKALKETFDS